MNTAPISGPSGWTPPAYLRSWLADNAGEHPLLSNPRFPPNDYLAEQVGTLLGTDPNALAALESQLSSTANLAGITAQGLEDAKAASDWEGQAADQYRHTLGKLPRDLGHVSQSYMSALAPVSTFTDTMLQLKAQYVVFEQELTSLKQKWAAALDATYLDEPTGWAAIRYLQNQLLEQCANGKSILGKSAAALDELHGQIVPLYPPPKGLVTTALTPIKGLWHMIEGTPGAVLAYAEDPTSWSKFQTMCGDLGVDAGVIVALAGLVVPGLDLVDVGAGATTIEAVEDAQLAAKAVQFEATVGYVGSSAAQHDWGAAAIGSFGLVNPGLESEQLDSALEDVQLLDTDKALVDADMNPNDPRFFSPQDLARLRKLVPDGECDDPTKVEMGLQNANLNVARLRRQYGLVQGAKGFANDQATNGASSAAQGSAPPPLANTGNGAGNEGPSIAPGASHNPFVNTSNGTGSGR